MTSRAAYDGTRRKIVLGFDVGTTYSGISYSILDPGQMPIIKGVTKFPAQETISGASKIPTIIYYDKNGQVQAVGAEATKDGIYETAMDQGWVKAEWFKLHLRSKYGSGKKMNENVPPLPPNKTVVNVFADFLHYLLECASSYIQDTHPSGVDLWKAHRGEIHFVLSHPNGWEGNEQSQMRQAAVEAGLVPDTLAGHDRVSFVTEGEASLHFAIENGVLSKASEGEGIVIVDAGGGTIDVSTYKRTQVSDQAGRSFEEIAIPQCYFHGSVFVTFKAKEYLKKFLSDSKFVDDVDHIATCFDKTTKPRFRNVDEPQYIKFGGARDNDVTSDIRFGQMKLPGTEVAKFFQPSIDCIIQAVMEQRKTSHKKITHVILVGGFAASDWLFEKVRTTLTQRGLSVIRPESYVNKAVSDGAVSFYLDHHVRSRVSKVSYGIKTNREYVGSDPEHRKRVHTQCRDAEGIMILPNGFRTILAKNTQVSETQEFKRVFTRTVPNISFNQMLVVELFCYRGDEVDPEWIDIDPSNYTSICHLHADISHLPKIPQINPFGQIFHKMEMSVILLFGLTELQAQLSWIEDGSEHRSPARLIFEAAVDQ